MLALLLVLAGCGGAARTPTEEPNSDGSASSTAPPTGGTIEEPTIAEPVEATLEWRDTGVPAGTRYVKGAEWEALTNAQSTTVELARDGDAVTIAAGSGRTISEVLMTDTWAVVVRQDKAETDPSQAATVDLADGRATRPRLPRAGQRRILGAHRRRPLLPDVRRGPRLLPGHRRAGGRQRRGRLVRRAAYGLVGPDRQ